MKTNLSRREMIRALGAATALLGTAPPLLSASLPARKRLGICIYSYGMQLKAGREGNPKAHFKDTLSFIEYCHQLGAGGVQMAVGSKESADAVKVREKIESLEMYFEGQTSLPKDESDLARFEMDIRLAREAGAEVVRTACLSGRRYETFASAEAFRDFSNRSWRSLTLAAPVATKHKVRLAVENHKDWRLSEMLDWLNRLGSEHVGACVDTGNNLALLDDPMEVVEALAPLSFSTHIKDMAVQEYEEGFLLSEVPIGQGFLDLRRMISILQKANPKIQFSLEMITRDPLKIPCLTEKYWVTMQDAPAHRLAAALMLVRRVRSKGGLPRTTGLEVDQQIAFEDENVRRSIAAGQILGL